MSGPERGRFIVFMILAIYYLVKGIRNMRKNAEKRSCPHNDSPSADQ